MTYSTPHSLSIAALSSPVYAPDSFQCMFCAPSLMFVPLMASLTAAKFTAGVQTTTSQTASLTSGARAVTSSRASLGVLFIFQLPAMIGLRMAVLSFNSVLILANKLKTARSEEGSRGNAPCGVWGSAPSRFGRQPKNSEETQFQSRLRSSLRLKRI